LQVVAVHLKPSSSKVTVNSGKGLTWSIWGAHAEVHGDWRIKYTFIKLSGRFSAKASGASVTVSVTLRATANGESTITVTGCNSHISGVSVKLHVRESWLYGLFTGSLEKLVLNKLEQKLCHAAKYAISVNADRELRTLRYSFPLQGPNKQMALNYKLVSSPAFAKGYMESFHKGEFFSITDNTEAPFEPSPLPSPRYTSHMVTFWISDYVFNTAEYVMHKSGKLRYNMTKNDLPEIHRDRLNTTCSILYGCIGVLIPRVAYEYPDSSVEVEVLSKESPTTKIDTKNFVVRFIWSIAFRVRLQNGSLNDLLEIIADQNVFLVPRIEQRVVKFRVSSIDETVTIANTTVGEIPVEVLKYFLDTIKETIIVPKVNESGESGLPIPAIKHVTFINPQLKLEKNCVRLSTNVAYKANR